MNFITASHVSFVYNIYLVASVVVCVCFVCYYNHCNIIIIIIIREILLKLSNTYYKIQENKYNLDHKEKS